MIDDPFYIYVDVGTIATGSDKVASLITGQLQLSSSNTSAPQQLGTKNSGQRTYKYDCSDVQVFAVRIHEDFRGKGHTPSTGYKRLLLRSTAPFTNVTKASPVTE